MIVRFVLLLIVLLYNGWAIEQNRYSIEAANKALKELEQLEDKNKGCEENSSAARRSKKVKISPLNRAGIHYNSAFFDIYPSHVAPRFDYILYSPENSFNVRMFFSNIRNIHERNIKSYIKAKILVPKEVATKRVRLYSGEDFRYKGWDGERFIIYNNEPKTQYVRTPLVDVQTDAKGRRYISFIITFFIYTPYKLDDSSEILPDKYIFQVAPDTENFQKKFRKTDIFIVEE